MRARRLLLFLLASFHPGTAVVAQSVGSDSASAVAVVARFHAALAAADSGQAVSLLAGDAMILESGAIQTRADYLSHHLGADMKASAGSKAQRAIVRVTMAGGSVIVVSKSVSPPTGAEGNTGSEMAELMVVSKMATGWQIRAVHWSSRRRKS